MELFEELEKKFQNEISFLKKEIERLNNEISNLKNKRNTLLNFFTKN